MRRLVSILLLLAFVLPCATPLLAATMDDDSSVPICCRRDGSHHCQGLRITGSAQTNGPTVSAPPACCPYRNASTTAIHPQQLAAPTAQAIYAELLRTPAAIAQTESRYRIAREHARGKRGPPSTTSL